MYQEDTDFNIALIMKLSDKIESVVESYDVRYGISSFYDIDDMFEIAIHDRKRGPKALVFMINKLDTAYQLYSFRCLISDDLAWLNCGGSDECTNSEEIETSFILTDKSNCDDIFVREIEPNLRIFLNAFKKRIKDLN